ncbi:hypothetical protein J2787_004346 [Chryseobacterium rhizosphaerae]|uniref:Uncharacterized protein n=1 Tax=Chryseobacterium rhizosphaerae TaxID=395937 RepID=A0AAE3YEB6_9FLAO|nr:MULTISPECIES: hypothetical protein [Chryseobacterium]MDR6528907.1 hypothetical protein [Chryseobacterium rhizosphaerae]
MKKLFRHPKNKLGLRNKKNLSDRTYYSQFVALFYIRNINSTLSNDITEILRMLEELQHLNNKSRLVFSTHCALSKHNRWQSILAYISDSLGYIRFQFEYVKENITQKNKFNSPLFWQQNKIYIEDLTENHEKMVQLGIQILPEAERLSWKTTVCNFYDKIFSLIVPLINICRLESDFVEKFTPKILNTITLDIIKNIPKNYTLKEATDYQQEYLKALTNYNNELNGKNNLWDTLLNLLSGGVHQSPSERVMLKRWINGKDER